MPDQDEFRNAVGRAVGAHGMAFSAVALALLVAFVALSIAADRRGLTRTASFLGMSAGGAFSAAAFLFLVGALSA